MKRPVVMALLMSCILGAGIAYAATTAWGEYRVDLVRCADAAGICGPSQTGSDPLASGRITLDSTSVGLRLRGAQPDTKYRIIFVQLKNNGTLSGGPFSASGSILGEVQSDKHGNASVTVKKTASTDPRVGYFLIGRQDGSAYEFVTGIDQVAAQ